MERDKVYLEHIVEAVKRIKKYTDKITVDEFKKDPLVQDGVVRQLEIIGEAARIVSEASRRKRLPGRAPIHTPAHCGA